MSHISIAVKKELIVLVIVVVKKMSDGPVVKPGLGAVQIQIVLVVHCVQS